MNLQAPIRSEQQQENKFRLELIALVGCKFANFANVSL